MPEFFRNFFRNLFSSHDDYDLVRLVDRRHFVGSVHGEIAKPPFDIICDIDKTYLETEFDTVVDLARTAMEDSRAKVTVFGAREVLLAARWARGTPPSGLHFVSSSPPQLRRVLEAKLAMDGLDWTSDTFKNQAYNLRKRRLSLLRHHVAYKTLAILSIMEDRGPGGRYVMIGDNAESDPLVYSGVARLLAARVSVEEFQQHLVNAGSQDFETAQIMPVAHKVHGSGSVAGIFIRKVPGSSGYKPFVTDAQVWPPMSGFTSFFEVATGMVEVGVLPPDADVIFKLATAIHNSALIPVPTLIGQLRQRAGECSSLEVAGAFRAAAIRLEDHMPASWLIRAPLN